MSLFVRQRGAVLVCASVLALLCIPSICRAQNWPEFRGPHGDGHADVKSAPTKWSESNFAVVSPSFESNKLQFKALTCEAGENIKWKTPIKGKAWSSPVVWGKQVWMTNAPPDGSELYAVCLDLDTGKEIHNVLLWKVAEPQFCHDMNSYASCTPALEEGRGYFHFGVHGTACVDLKTGKVIWDRPPFDPDLPCNHHRGAASSPIIHGKHIFLTFDGFDLQYVVALDKETGKTVWKTDRNIAYKSDNGDVKKAYSTPAVFKIDGKEQLVSPSAEATIAYNPENGSELWRVTHGGMNGALRPLYSHGLIYLTTYSGGIQLFALKPEGTGDITKNIAWKQEKGAAKRSSPIVVDDKIYMVSDEGILSCVDALTGKLVWSKRAGGTWASSPVYAAGKIYFFDIEGKSYVLNPGDKYDEVAENKLDAGCMASPAVVEGALIVRTKQAVYRIGE